jgi:hypothetical protein
MKELIKPITLLTNCEALQFHCETFNCSSCPEVVCNKNCKDNPTGNYSTSENEYILL